MRQHDSIVMLKKGFKKGKEIKELEKQNKVYWYNWKLKGANFCLEIDSYL